MKKKTRPYRPTAEEIELRESAATASKLWLSAHGLTRGLRHKCNAKARAQRRRFEAPSEPKANVRHRRYRDKQLGKLGKASKMRQIDPETESG